MKYCAWDPTDQIWAFSLKKENNPFRFRNDVDMEESQNPIRKYIVEQQQCIDKVEVLITDSLYRQIVPILCGSRTFFYGEELLLEYEQECDQKKSINPEPSAKTELIRITFSPQQEKKFRRRSIRFWKKKLVNN